jgi:hypothetical protein
MPFGLKNAGATFQRLMHKALGDQMGRNAEAYVDDIVVKTRESHTFIEDLEETFTNLRKVNIKLNPTECTFGVPSGKLLGFLVPHRGTEANPDKVKAIEEVRPPRNLKEMQCLAGCMAALRRFIAWSGEKALPFSKPADHGCPNIPRALATIHRGNPENCKRCPHRRMRRKGNHQRGN